MNDRQDWRWRRDRSVQQIEVVGVLPRTHTLLRVPRPQQVLGAHAHIDEYDDEAQANMPKHTYARRLISLRKQPCFPCRSGGGTHGRIRYRFGDGRLVPKWEKVASAVPGVSGPALN